MRELTNRVRRLLVWAAYVALVLVIAWAVTAPFFILIDAEHLTHLEDQVHAATLQRNKVMQREAQVTKKFQNETKPLIEHVLHEMDDICTAVHCSVGNGH